MAGADERSVGTPRRGPPPAVARVLERVTATARRHRMFEPGTTIVVAVSGGPDSLCLLDALWRLRQLLRLDLACFHFDHRLRQGSDQDARYVMAQAKRRGVRFVLRRAGSSPRHGESVEAWARRERYRALRSAVVALEAAGAAVGHTLDDQAETVLLAMVRGGGIQALSAMRPVSGIVVRPLLEVTRDDTVAYCRSLRLKPRADPMNDDPSYTRVAIRKALIPALEDRLGRNIRATLGRSASLLREDADFIEGLADDAARQAIVVDERAEYVLSVRALSSLARPIAARVIRRWTRQHGLLAEAAHVEAIHSLAAAGTGAEVALPGGLVARREKEYVRLSRASPASPVRESPRLDKEHRQ